MPHPPATIFEVVAIGSPKAEGTAVHMVTDSQGALALLECEERYGGGWFDDPGDHDETWYSVVVGWSRSGTVHPGAFRSNSIAATAAAIGAWESAVTADERLSGVVADHGRAVERAELASAEALRVASDEDQVETAMRRAIRFVAEKHRLDEELRGELERFGLLHDLSTRRPSPDPLAFLERGITDEALGVVCRESVLDTAVACL